MGSRHSPDRRWATRPHPDLRVGLPTLRGTSGGPFDPSLTSAWDSRTFPKVRVGLPD